MKMIQIKIIMKSLILKVSVFFSIKLLLSSTIKSKVA